MRNSAFKINQQIVPVFHYIVADTDNFIEIDLLVLTSSEFQKL